MLYGCAWEMKLETKKEFAFQLTAKMFVVILLFINHASLLFSTLLITYIHLKNPPPTPVMFGLATLNSFVPPTSLKST